MLDTLIRPQHPDLMLKSGLRRQMVERALQDAESLDTVKQRILELARGKNLVGYHLPMRLENLGLLKLKKCSDQSSENDTRSESDESQRPPQQAQPHDATSNEPKQN